MATRTFCDHCGNTVTKPTVLSFGPFMDEIRREAERQRAYEQQAASIKASIQTGYGGSAPNPGVATQAQVQPKPAHPQVKIVNVDLCNTCVPIWFERVSNLCKASDPKED